ncbi:MAG: iron ABC transporter permease [Gammaproteobacteria bacterium]|nr:iron ABC transporter permease [Gammaproteobacteria bacterium]MDH5727777.1 iron ABC transporter permease [Gammaproteobacteria bacterium]
MRATSLFLSLIVASIISLYWALVSGSVSSNFAQVLDALWTHQDTVLSQVLWELRIPRALSAYVTGALLALAGVLMQVLLRNPLADPYVLGISGGAAVAVLAGMLFGAGVLLLNLGAFLGALISTLIVFALSHGKGSWTPTRLLLTGVVVAAGWGALISFILAIAPERDLPGMLFWLMGDLSYASMPGLASLLLFFGLITSWFFARDLNMLIRGELSASALGVSVLGLRRLLFFLAALLTASAVTTAGSVGFVGLIVPHMVRLLMGSDHRILIPASVLLGGSLLCLADTLARSLIAPQQLPVGVITALIGVPVFLFLLNRGGARL